MRRRSGLAWILFSAGAFSGCVPAAYSNVSRPIPLKDALAILQKDLRGVSPVTLTDVGAASDGESRVIDEIGIEQCRQGRANPLMPVVNGPLTLQLQGEFQVGGEVGFTVGVPISVSVQASAQQQQSQLISVPLSFVALAGLADFHFGQDMANFANLPDALKTAQANELLKTREKIRRLTKILMDAYPGTLQPKCAELKAGTLKTATLLKPLLP